MQGTFDPHGHVQVMDDGARVHFVTTEVAALVRAYRIAARLDGFTRPIAAEWSDTDQRALVRAAAKLENADKRIESMARSARMRANHPKPLLRRELAS